MNDYTAPARTVYVEGLLEEVTPEVWRRLAGNGSLVIHIDTDVDCYGQLPPQGDRQVEIAYDWMQYFVRSTINRLVDTGHLQLPESTSGAV